jgi:hypothetical protein
LQAAHPEPVLTPERAPQFAQVVLVAMPVAVVNVSVRPKGALLR